MDEITGDLSDLLSTPDKGACLRSAALLLAAFLPCDVVAWCRVDVPARSIEAVGIPEAAFRGDATAAFAAASADHPMLTRPTEDRATMLPAPRRLSDLISPEAWHRTASYRDVLRHFAGEHQLVLGVNGEQYRTGWAFNRARADFTDTEVTRARGIQPLLLLLDRSLGTGQDGGDPVSHPDLTVREQQVLDVMAAGVTPAACGRLLGISPRTVDKHLEHAYRKLGCDNLIGALARLRSPGVN